MAPSITPTARRSRSSAASSRGMPIPLSIHHGVSRSFRITLQVRTPPCVPKRHRPRGSRFAQAMQLRNVSHCPLSSASLPSALNNRRNSDPSWRRSRNSMPSAPMPVLRAAELSRQGGVLALGQRLFDHQKIIAARMRLHKRDTAHKLLLLTVAEDHNLVGCNRFSRSSLQASGRLVAINGKATALRLVAITRKGHTPPCRRRYHSSSTLSPLTH